MHAYKSLDKGKKIFNNGINTSLYVYETFREVGYIRHLDNPVITNEKIFYMVQTCSAILTSVGF
jgi:hypothetical protein